MLKPTDSGWWALVAPESPCEAGDDWAYVVNPPYRNYNSQHTSAEYGVTAGEAVNWGPREILFVTNCEDYKRESKRLEIVLWPYTYTKAVADDALAKLGTSLLGKLTLRIVASRVSRAPQEVEGKNYGRIDWIRFTVDVAGAEKRGIF